MGLIKKIETAVGTIYERYDSDSKMIQRTGAVGFVKEYKGKVYYIITDINGVSIKEANKFLNFSLEDSSIKKREQAFSALKIFYSYISLFQLNNYRDGIDNENLNKLLKFLKGGKQNGNILDFDFKLERKHSTLRPYLSVYREFYDVIFNIREGPLFKKTLVQNYQHDTSVYKTEKLFMAS